MIKKYIYIFTSISLLFPNENLQLFLIELGHLLVLGYNMVLKDQLDKK